MAKVLKDYFSMIRDREEVLADIYGNESLLEIYDSWTEEQQELFLAYCTGARGVKILYDEFFKMIINPEKTPERLEKILTLLIGERIRILQVLPNESTRIAAEKSLLVLDIVVELENGSIANVEVQRIGYAFPGQRSACYSADLLMRQYKRTKKRKKKNFKYSDIKKVYTVVFFEKSSTEFHKFDDIYLHRSRQQTDSGLQIELLQEYIFVALDIFKKYLHNRGVKKNNELEAWLTFLCEDSPEWILKLIKAYPEFGELYEEVYQICRNTEVMMGLFSEELLEMDKNTVEFMIDEMQDTIDAQKEKLKKQIEEIDKQKEMIGEQERTIGKQNEMIQEQNKTIEEMEALIKKLQKELKKEK